MTYTIIYKNIKNGYVRLSNDGKLNITIPNFLKNNENFKQMLINKGQTLLLKQKKKNYLSPINDDHIIIFGEDIPIKEIISANKSLSKNKITNKKQLENQIKEILYEYLKPIVDKYADLLGYNYKEIKIKKLKSKRGSCSHDQILLFNRDLVHLPTQYIKYVIIHEVCHLKIKNHSFRFRDLVSKYCPDYKTLRKKLRNFVIK